MIITCAGRYVGRLIQNGYHGAVHPNVAESMRTQFQENGFAFGLNNGHWSRRWGWTIVKPEKVFSLASRVELNVLDFMERGWDGRQDIYSFARL